MEILTSAPLKFPVQGEVAMQLRAFGGLLPKFRTPLLDRILSQNEAE